MRTLMFVAALLLVVSGMSAGGDSAFLQLEQTSRNGTVHFIGKNVSHSPIVAYVVVVERSHQRAVWQGVYTGGDALEERKTVELGDLPADPGEQVKVFVDYVRLADGTAWGQTATDEAKAVAARFQK